MKEIVSPMVGTFYRAGSPDAPAFVEVGKPVTEDTVVCIIEAMKLLNEIESDADGVIKEILVENGETVQYGQPLFGIDTVVPGMLHGRMIRPAVAGAVPIKVDESSIKGIPGAQVVHKDGFLGVLAPRALRCRHRTTGPGGQLDTIQTWKRRQRRARGSPQADRGPHSR